MYEIIVSIFVFCIVLFFYLHIQFHLKISNDLEIYEISQASKERIEEICDLRQPVLLDVDKNIEQMTKLTNLEFLEANYPIFDIKIRNTADLFTDKDISVPLKLHMASKLFGEDVSKSYFSENNMDFLNETGVIKSLSHNDELLRPSLVSNCHYDVLLGSEGVQTPFRYDLNYRNYYVVTQGSVEVKLTPPKNSKYLYVNVDYEGFEFKSPVNPWNTQPKYLADFEKVKCLDILLTPGKILFIPAYWWYSFKFAANTSVSCFKYRTYMNNIAISPSIFLYVLQNQNVERKIGKKLVIETETHDDSVTDVSAPEPN